MITLFFMVLFFCFMIALGVHLTGAFLMALVWLFVRLPLSLVLLAVGIVLCCTIILIPLGVMMIRGGCRLMMPVMC
ncbi:MAG: hypothetical protein Q4B72_05995 [Lachnospiraceae bacterium]|nr:hypothetical protein [Lachnospiraceae bacterium]